MNDAEQTLLKSLLARGRTVRMPVTGQSMHPVIRNEDIVDIAPVALGRYNEPPPLSLRAGRIALCAPIPGKLVLHRLVSVNRNQQGQWWIQTASDRSAVCDPPWPIHSVLGIAVRTCRADGTGRIFFDSPLQRLHARVILARGRLRRSLRAWRQKLRSAVRQGLGAIPPGVRG